jgi:DNA-binding transcriptional MerR regulator/methylmalonyl-CoA mutase cobalamin-binding subunit
LKTLPDAVGTEAHQPIAVVAERTGLSQDVLRAWERRYGAVRPTRDAGGQRQYTDADIRRLGLLQAATRAGRSIGSVAALPTDQIASLVEGDLAARERRAPPEMESPVSSETVDEAFAHSRALDASALDTTLRRAATAMGVTAFIETVAAPLLRRVGDEWHAGRLAPPQEHLVSSVLHDIIVATMRAFPQRSGAPKVLVATPAGDRHSIGAALVGAASALEGWNVLYLGADLPAADIADAARTAGVRIVALSIVYTEDRARVLGEVRALRSRLPADMVLIAGGAGATSLATELAAMDVRVESSVSGLVAELRRHRHAG